MTEQIAAPRQKRLQILGDDEIENLYGFPRFTSEEQIEYFTLLPKEFAAIEQLPPVESRIYTILQLGYFKAPPSLFYFQLLNSGNGY